MASARVGVVGAAEVNGPINSNGSSGKLADPQAASTWAVAWFVFAIIVLFFVL